MMKLLKQITSMLNEEKSRLSRYNRGLLSGKNMLTLFLIAGLFLFLQGGLLAQDKALQKQDQKKDDVKTTGEKPYEKLLLDENKATVTKYENKLITDENSMKLEMKVMSSEEENDSEEKNDGEYIYKTPKKKAVKKQNAQQPK